MCACDNQLQPHDPLPGVCPETYKQAVTSYPLADPKFWHDTRQVREDLINRKLREELDRG